MVGKGPSEGSGLGITPSCDLVLEEMAFELLAYIFVEHGVDGGTRAFALGVRVWGYKGSDEEVELMGKGVEVGVVRGVVVESVFRETVCCGVADRWEVAGASVCTYFGDGGGGAVFGTGVDCFDDS